MKNKWSLTLENFYATCLKLGLNLDLNIKSNHIKKIWLGFSGGLDSRVLLELTRLAFFNNANANANAKLIAVHINHSINKNADLWEEHCYQTCKKLNVDFKSIKIIADPNQINVLGSQEASLRLARIKIWKKLVSENDILLLAHHLNDQIETVFLRLLRGSGIKGLAAIQPVAKINHLTIIRPLLNNSRAEIENFAKQNNLCYIQDDSNSDQKFTRNFLRHAILPKLNNRWPKLLGNINRTVRHLQQADLFITNKAQIALNNCYGYPNYYHDDNSSSYGFKNILLISKLLKYDDFLQTEILRLFIINQGFYPPDEDKLHKIYTEVIAAGVDRQPKLNLREYFIRRYRDQLYIYPAKCLTAMKPSFQNIIGDLAIYVGDAISKVSLIKAKKIFQKFGIPPWQRYNYPLIFRDKKLIAIIGLWFMV